MPLDPARLAALCEGATPSADEVRALLSALDEARCIAEIRQELKPALADALARAEAAERDRDDATRALAVAWTCITETCGACMACRRKRQEAAEARAAALAERVATLEAALNTPELHDFARGVVSEAQHQRARWSAEHDAGKTAADWFWLVGYLAGKALHAQGEGRVDKALHHVVTTAAALANWHAAILGRTTMRPGIDAALAPASEKGAGDDAAAREAGRQSADATWNAAIGAAAKAADDCDSPWAVATPEQDEGCDMMAKRIAACIRALARPVALTSCPHCRTRLDVACVTEDGRCGGCGKELARPVAPVAPHAPEADESAARVAANPECWACEDRGTLHSRVEGCDVPCSVCVYAGRVKLCGCGKVATHYDVAPSGYRELCCGPDCEAGSEHATPGWTTAPLGGES